MFQAKMRTNNSVTAIVDGTPYTVGSDHPNYDLILQAMTDNDPEKFIALQKESEGVKVFASVDSTGKATGITVEDNRVLYNGKELHSVIVDRILGLRQSGLPVDDMVTFLEQLLQNPSSQAVKELYDFLEHKNLPITDDGCFLAYKSVRNDFYSKYAGSLTLIQGSDKDGRIYNGVGEVIECPRNEVDDERVHECSHGLHVGALGYSGPNGWYHNSSDNVIIVKVNPKDVVSVPRDHGAQKVRVCKYEVLSLFNGPLPDHTTTAVEDDDWDDDDDDWENDEYMDFDDLEEDQELRFEYKGETRYAKVEAVYSGSGSFTATLLENDPSYSVYQVQPQYRNFVWSNCDEVELF